MSDIAIVLGGYSEANITTSEHLEFNRAAERLTEAVALWKDGRMKHLLITSGSDDLLDQDLKEAPPALTWVRSMGVPEEAVIIESESRNTVENASLTLPLIKAANYRSIILITSAVHMPRSAAIFRKAGFDREGRSLILWPVDTHRSPRGFPFNAVPDPVSLTTVQGLLKEVVGYGVYALQGYL